MTLFYEGSCICPPVRCEVGRAGDKEVNAFHMEASWDWIHADCNTH